MSLRLQTIGVVLIIIGALILVGRGFASNFGNLGWPLYSIVPGILMLIVAFLSRGGTSGLAVPGSIVTTVGAILFLQNVTGRFETWSYTWALVLASVGAGIFLHAALKDDAEEERLGLRLVFFGLTMFVIFGIFFEFVIFSRSSESASGSFLAPMLLILAGVFLLNRWGRSS